MSGKSNYRGLGLLLFLCTSLALADGFRNPPESASALGRAGGKIAQVDDVSAAAINPANLTEVKGPAVSTTLSVGHGTREFKSPLGFTEKTEDPWSFLPSAFASCPFNDGKFAAGVAVTFPFGRFTRWDEDAFAGATPYYSSLQLVSVNPVVAARLGKRVSVAAGFSVYQSKLETEMLVPWSTLTPGLPNGIGKASGDGTAFGANAALSWRVTDKQTIAVTYRSPFDIEYEGDFDVSNVPGMAAALGITASSDFKTEMKYPTVVALGYGIRLTDTLDVEVDVEWVQSSRNKEIANDIGNNNVILNASQLPQVVTDPLVMRQDWEDNWTFGIGVGWKFQPDWTARAGFIYLETPTPTSTLIPVASENDQGVASLGLGWKRGSHCIDVAYLYGITDTRKVNDNDIQKLSGQYGFQTHLASLSYGYTF